MKALIFELELTEWEVAALVLLLLVLLGIRYPGAREWIFRMASLARWRKGNGRNGKDEKEGRGRAD